MGLTFGQIRRLVAPYAGRAGKCPTSPDVASYARTVLNYLLISGDQAANRKVCLLACKGCFSLPPEVEIPLKIKIDRKVTEVWNKWYSFHSAPLSNNLEGYCAVDDFLVEDGSHSPLVHPLPECGALIGVMSTCDEEPNCFVTVQERDRTGREVYTSFRGEQVVGEKFELRKNEIRHGEVVVGDVTAVQKPKTNGYVVLFAIDPITKRQRFLADYAPSEERPMYRRFQIVGRKCDPIVHISMLCRIKLKDNYHDNEITPFENEIAITLAAQRIQSETNNDSNQANYKRQATENVLDIEAGYKKISGNPLDVFYPLSGGSIKKIYGY